VAAQALAVFVAIVVITHRYLILTINDRWAPTIFDTLIPYALGVGEITTAVVIGRNVAWWIAVSVLFLAAAGTYAHTYMRGPGTQSQGSERKSIRIRMIYCCALLLYAATVAALAAANIISGWLDIVLPGGTTIGAIAVAINGERAQNRLYDAYGIPRWRLRLSSLSACRSNRKGRERGGEHTPRISGLSGPVSAGGLGRRHKEISGVRCVLGRSVRRSALRLKPSAGAQLLADISLD
jgi:hypothetical protein